jgi:hypothetical protein
VAGAGGDVEQQVPRAKLQALKQPLSVEREDTVEARILERGGLRGEGAVDRL